MGCISSKQARSSRKKSQPAFDSPVIVRDDVGSVILDSSLNLHSEFGPLEKIKEESEDEKEDESVKPRHRAHGGHSKPLKKSASTSVKRAAFSLKFGRLTEGEHVAAGWPAWLTAVAGEAIDGWLPLRSDTFERLEKVIDVIIIHCYC